MVSGFPNIARRLWRGLAALASVALLVGPSVAQDPLSTLESIRQRGHLVCGASRAMPGFSQAGESGIWSGFDVDICRAIAAAVFGDANKVEFRSLTGDSRFAQLQTGVVDVIARNAPWTMSRDTGYGASYVGTVFFDGQAFMVPQDLGFVSAYELDDVSVCVVAGDDLTRMRDFFFETQATYSEVVYEDLEDLGVAYRSGLCNAVSGPARWLNSIRRTLPEPAIHRILPERISKEPLGPLVREGDDEWFNIVKWTMNTLINAEEMGINSLNLDSIAAARNPGIQRLLGLEGDFGTPLGLKKTFMADIIRSVGNYAEIYERNFGPQTGAALPRGQNSLWTNGGLLYAPPVR